MIEVTEFLKSYGVLGLWTITLLVKEGTILRDLKELMIEIRGYFKR